MRFTLEPGGDLEVAAGTVLGACREDLVRLIGAPLLRHAVLTVDGHALADDHMSGAPPWLPGSVVRVGTGEPDPRALAVTAPWHLAVVAGPDAGLVAVPGRDGTIRVGRHGPGTDGRARLSLSDPSVSRSHLQVRLRRGRWPRRTRWVVQDLGSVNGTELTAGSRRRRPVHGRERGLRSAEAITLGGTTVVPRRGCDVADAWPDATPRGRSSTVPGRSGAPDATSSSGGVATGGSWIAGALASLALAATTRNPVFLVLVLAGPLGTAIPRLVRTARERARRRRAEPRSSAPPGPGSRRQGHTRGGPPVSAFPGQVRALGPDAAWSSVRLAAQLATSTPTPTATATATAPHQSDRCSAAPWWELAREGLAIVGARSDVLGVVRAALGSALLDDALDLSLLITPDADADWAWCRWLAHRLRDGRAGRTHRPQDAARVLGATSAGNLVLADGATHWRAALHLWWLADRHEGDALVVLDEDRAAVPQWCRWVLAVAPDGSALLTGDAEQHRVTAPAAPARWIEAHARRVAAQDARGDGRLRTGVAGGAGGLDERLPDRVSLADLGLPGDPTAVRDAWGGTAVRPMSMLRATVGVGLEGVPVTVDLLAEGPHMLVAGTTGAGKSELLQSLVLSLALRHPPTELAVVLVDYKGGASFGPCRDLPHVVGQVTDLDQVEAARALDGVRAELRRRERVLADAGVGDLESLRSLRAVAPASTDPPPPPRLLVVVDEFRALTEDLPDFVPGLVRIAAQGRSLGIHLVLATQRPAGAVSGQMRANVALRLCLRVTEAADSTDVVEVPDAADLPVDRPGRAILRRGAGRPEVLQTAWAALPPGGWVPTGTPGAATVRRAAQWSATAPRAADPSTSRHGTGSAGTLAATDHTGVLVGLMREAAASGGFAQPSPVWLAPLPTTVDPALLRATSPTEDATGIPLALVDVPGRQSRSVLRWDGGGGALVITGRPGSGRTGALRTAAHEALARGWHVHVVTGTGTADWDGRDGGHPGLGTVVGADDPRRVAHLLTALLAGTPGPQRLLLVDDIGMVRRGLDDLPRGAATDLLERALRDGRHRGLVVAVAGAPADVVRLLPHAGDRVVLAVADPHDDMLLGVPRAFLGGRDTPGRAVHLGPGGAQRCQLASPDLAAAACTDHGVGLPVARPQDRDSGSRTSAPLRLLAVPSEVRRTDLPAPTGQLLAVGRGGDDAGPVALDVSVGALVVGPAGSGRSTALATIVLGLRASGRPPLVLARSGPLSEVARQDPARHGTPRQAGVLLQGLVQRSVGPGTATGGPPPVVVVDDLDLLAAADPGADDLLARWAAAAESGDGDVPRVVGSARTDRAAAAYRGAVAALRSAAPVLVLCPSTPGSHEVAGTDLSLEVDPRHPARAGAGVLVHRGRQDCLQIAAGLPGSDPDNDPHNGADGLSPRS